MQAIDPIVTTVTHIDQLKIKIRQRISSPEDASPDGSPPNPSAPPPPLDNNTGNKSNNSSCTDLSQPSPMAEGVSPNANTNANDNNNTPTDQQQPHHLLKHHLHPENAQALSHFETEDVKEAAREISRMGQRDLQAKFKLVYGTQTHSNNNEWLRRKLYEAIGALPIKTNANKSRGRRHHQGGSTHQLPRLRTTTGAAAAAGSPPTAANGASDQQQQHQNGTSSPRVVVTRRGAGGGGLVRSPANTPRKLIAMELKRRMSLVPSSPRFYTSSVLDAHRNISDETDSSGDDNDDDDVDDGGSGGEHQDESTLIVAGSSERQRDVAMGMAVPHAAPAAASGRTITTATGHLRSFTRLSTHQQQQQNNSKTVVLGTFIAAQDMAYYTPPSAAHQAMAASAGNSGSGTMRRASRAGLSRLQPTYSQQQQQQPSSVAKLSSLVGCATMPRSSSTTQLLKSMDLDVLGDREWPDALRFKPCDSFNLSSMPDDEEDEEFDEDEQQQFQMEGVNDAPATSGVMDYYYS